jgi:hypothetical protein
MRKARRPFVRSNEKLPVRAAIGVTGQRFPGELRTSVRLTANRDLRMSLTRLAGRWRCYTQLQPMAHAHVHDPLIHHDLAWTVAFFPLLIRHLT